MARGTDGIVVGIDLGTSSLKVLAVNERGEVRARASAGYPTLRPVPGAAEQRAEDWWQAARATLRSVCEQVNVEQVQGVAVTGQLNGLVAVDEHGSVLRHPVIWLDQRGAAESEEINARFAGELDRSAHARALPINLLTKWYWLTRNEPAVLERTRWVMAPKDYLVFRLTGSASTDLSDAGAGLLLDLRRRAVLEEVVRGLSLDPSRLPSLHESTEVVGTVGRRAHEETLLPEGLPVVAGAGDMTALAVGTGVVEPGTACVTLGSAGHIAAYAGEVPEALEPGLWVLVHALPASYFVHGLVMTGGLSLQWFHDTFGTAEQAAARLIARDSYDLLLDAAATTSPGSEGLLFLPFLEGAATPFNDPDLRAAFLGATPRHGKGHFARAVLEGVACNIRDSLEAIRRSGVPLRTVRAGEGGTRYRAWVQIIASLCQVPVEVLSEHDLSALGACLIAGAGVGLWETFPQAVARSVRVRERVDPEEGWLDTYHALYQRYLAACAAVVPLFRRPGSFEGDR